MTASKPPNASKSFCLMPSIYIPSVILHILASTERAKRLAIPNQRVTKMTGKECLVIGKIDAESALQNARRGE